VNRYGPYDTVSSPVVYCLLPHMLRVWSDILTAADQRHVTMSAAFDCVDHDLLLQRLHLGFGLSGVVLEWIRTL